MVTRGNPLRELPQILTLEQLPQLRLTQQNHLQQLVFGRLQVGQQAHLLQRFRAEILRLVNHDHHASAQGMLRQQVRVKRVDHPLVAVPDAVCSDPQFLANRGEQFTRRHQGVEHQSHLAILRHLLHQTTAQRGLTGTDFACQLDKPTRTALSDTIHQVGQGIAMRRAQINKRWIWRDRKRRFIQSEMLQIQGVLSGQSSNSSKLALPPTAAVLTVSVRSVANLNM